MTKTYYDIEAVTRLLEEVRLPYSLNPLVLLATAPVLMGVARFVLPLDFMFQFLPFVAILLPIGTETRSL